MHSANEKPNIPYPKEHNRDNGCRGIDALLYRPSEPEQADGKHKAARHGWVETVLGGDLVQRELGRLGLAEQLVGDANQEKANQAADGDGEEDETALDQGVVICRARTKLVPS